MNTELEELNNYTGPSMKPTFRAGDGLIAVPYIDKKIHPGDVIIFKPKDRSGNVVHRVIRVGRDGVSTRGDNNNKIDPWLLTPEDITGRVVSVKRKNREFSVSGGLRGRVYGLFILRYNMLIRRVPGLLHSIYHIVSNTGIFRRLLPLLNTQLISYKRPKGAELQLVMGKRIIARRLPGSEQWQIKRPFRLFIDEKTLP